MILRLRRLLALSCAVVAAPLAAQHTWIVSQNGGPGVDFTDIPPAIAAASAGDRIEVRLAAVYSAFRVDRGIDVEATEGAVVPRFSIEGIPSSQVARVAGFTVDPPPDDERVAILGNAGPVTLASVVVKRGTVPFASFAHRALVIRDSWPVLLVDCSIEGQAGYRYGGAEGVYAASSRVTFQRCTLLGGPGGSTANVGGSGGSAVSFDDSWLRVAASIVRGGQGNTGNVAGGSGGDALVLFNGSHGLASSSELTGGRGGYGLSFSGEDGAAAVGDVQISSDCLVTGALEDGATLIATITRLVATSTALPGETVRLLFDGPAGSAVSLLGAVRHDHVELAGLLGPILLPPGAIIPLLSFTLPANGLHDLAFVVPNDPALRNRDVYFQAVVQEPGPGGRLTMTELGDLRVQ